MKTKYSKPEIEIMMTESEGIIATSPGINTTDTYENTPVRAKERSFWSE